MTSQGATTAVTTSALVVFGIYGYRRVIEGTAGGTGSGLSSLLGLGSSSKGGSFITAWGFTFFVLALLAEAAPELGGTLAITVAVSDFFTNATSLLGDVNKRTAKS